MHGEDCPNIKTQLIIGSLKFAEFPDHISIDCGLYSPIFKKPIIKTPNIGTDLAKDRYK